MESSKRDLITKPAKDLTVSSPSVITNNLPPEEASGRTALFDSTLSLVRDNASFISDEDWVDGGQLFFPQDPLQGVLDFVRLNTASMPVLGKSWKLKSGTPETGLFEQETTPASGLSVISGLLYNKKPSEPQSTGLFVDFTSTEEAAFKCCDGTPDEGLCEAIASFTQQLLTPRTERRRQVTQSSGTVLFGRDGLFPDAGGGCSTVDEEESKDEEVDVAHTTRSKTPDKPRQDGSSTTSRDLGPDFSERCSTESSEPAGMDRRAALLQSAPALFSQLTPPGIETPLSVGEYSVAQGGDYDVAECEVPLPCETLGVTHTQSPDYTEPPAGYEVAPPSPRYEAAQSPRYGVTKSPTYGVTQSPGYGVSQPAQGYDVTTSLHDAVTPYMARPHILFDHLPEEMTEGRPSLTCYTGSSASSGSSSGRQQGPEIIVQYRKTRMCRQFLQNKCNRTAEKCKFAHSRHERRHTRDVYKTKMCAFYQEGYCKLGLDCGYAHGEEQLRSRAAQAGEYVGTEKARRWRYSQSRGHPNLETMEAQQQFYYEGDDDGSLVVTGVPMQQMMWLGA